MKLLAIDVAKHILSDSSSAGTMAMVINFIVHFLFTYSNALYEQVIYGWDRTSAYTGAAGSCYQSISNLTQHMNE